MPIFRFPRLGSDRWPRHVVVTSMGPLLTMLVLGCGPTPTNSFSGACTFGTLEAHRLTLGGAPVYVNPAAVAAGPESLVLAGRPNYIHTPQGTLVDSLFGVELRRSGGVVAIPRLTRARLTRWHLATGPDSGFLAVVVEDVSAGRSDARASRVRSGELHDARWSRVATVPLAGLRPRRSRGWSSDLARSDGAAWLALGLVPADRILLLRYDRDGWSSPESAWRSGPGVGALRMLTDSDRSLSLVYTRFDPRDGNRLRTVEPVVPTSTERALYRPATPYTLSAFDVGRFSGGPGALLRINGHTEYLGLGEDSVVAIRLTAVPEDADVFLTGLPDGTPAAAWQPRRLGGGSTTLSIRAIHDSTTIFKVASPFAALQAVVAVPRGLRLIGTVFPDGRPAPEFASATAFLPIDCRSDSIDSHPR